MQNHLFEFNQHYGFQKSQICYLACQMFPSKPKFLQYEEEMKDYQQLLLDSPELTRDHGNIFPHDLLEDLCCFYFPKDLQL